MDKPNEDFKTEEVKDGWLACAKVVTTILHDAGMIDKIYINVENTVEALKSQGWLKTSLASPGNIVVWDRTEDYPYLHIGIVTGQNIAINNSSYLKMPVESKIDERPVLFYLAPKNAKEYIGEWGVSRYYTPVKGQEKYYGKAGTYEKDYKMNCQGDCLSTASGYMLAQKDEFKIVACPKNYELGSKFEIEGLGIVTCEDRGGAIKGKRLDLWVGIGDRGLDNVYGTNTSGIKKVYLLK